MTYIGIDPGTHTGVAVWNGKNFIQITTLPIHKALELVSSMPDAFVVFEDARMRKWYGRDARAKMQGAGSVKRDCSIWEDFLTDKNIKFQMLAPGKVHTKLTAVQFKDLTGYDKRTSEHARDAALLVYNLRTD